VNKACCMRLAVFMLSLAASGAPLADPCSKFYVDANLRSDIEPSIFKVYGYVGGSAIPIGSASLIHPDGYFLTASHIFDQNGSLPSGYKVGEKVTLKNSRGVTLEAKLYRLRAKKETDPDVALIQTDAKLNWSLGYPDTSLGWVPGPEKRWYPAWRNEDLAMLGYKLTEALPDYLDFRAGQFRLDRDEVFLALVTTGMVFNGESGSLALSKSALSHGVLRGRTDEDAAGVSGSTYRFTPTAYLLMTDWLLQLPKTPKVMALVEKMRAGALSSLDRQSVFEASWKQLELAQIGLEILAKAETRKGLDSNMVQSILFQCGCRAMLWLSTRLVRELPPELVTPNMPLEAARAGMMIVADLKKAGAPGRIQEAALSTTLQLFDAYVAKAPQKSGRYQSFAYYDYALTKTEAARYPGLAVSKESVRQTAEIATDLDPENGNAWTLRAKIARQRGDFAAAAEHTEKALTLNPSDSRLLKDLQFDKARAVRYGKI
jgi:hypothetical protein